MKESPLREKSMDLAVRIVSLAKALREEHKEFALADQVLRSGTSIGANLAEAAFAPTKKDFLNKCKIALKETSETLFGLNLFVRSDLFPEARITGIRNECEELRKMLSATCRTTEESLSQK